MSHPYPPQETPVLEEDTEELETDDDESPDLWWLPGAFFLLSGIYNFIQAFYASSPAGVSLEMQIAYLCLVGGAILLTVMGCNEYRKEQMNRIEETQQLILENQEAQRHFHEQQLRAMYGLPPE